MKPDPFVRAANSCDLVGYGPFALSASGIDVALVRSGAGWRAFQGRCPHQGALLGEGEIEGDRLVCRNHRWRFSLDSGRRDGGPECLASCPAVERDGVIFVDVSGLEPAPAKPAGKRSLDELPGPKPRPLVGNVHQIDISKAHLVLEGWAKQYGPTFRFWRGRTPVVVTSDAAMINEILRARPETFRRSAKTDETLSELGIKGVFNAEGEVWRSQRKLAVAALAQRNLKQLYPHIETVAHRLKRRWDRAAATGEALDVVDEMKRFTVDVTMLIAFGHDANTVEASNDVIQRYLEVILPRVGQRLFATVPIWRYVRLPSDRRLDRALAAVREWLGVLLAETRRRLEAGSGHPDRPANFLESMVTAVDEHGEPFSDATIMSNLITMLIAGEDTTAFTLAWAVHELCDAPRWRDALRREADDVFGLPDVAADVDAVNRLAVASAVANEALRLRPVAPFSGASANVDTSLGEYFVPKGTTILLLFRPEAVELTNFADPLAFKPARWLDAPSGPHNPSAQIPFGSGPRMCPGRSLALLEMKTLLSMMYKSFDVERAGRAEDVTELFGFTMSPAGLRIRLRPRSGAAH
ncbi:MAG: cytochrome P450 [Roseiarcus sp.]|uniref:cytochrome P450 n=1 Tax=Roseiarcus sp. TaxID=1969460 RepID=UPI003C6A22C5